MTLAKTQQIEMMKTISSKGIKFLQNQLQEYVDRIKKINEKSSVDFLGVGSSMSEAENGITFTMEVYLNGVEEFGLLFTIEITSSGEGINVVCFISKESHSFLLSPRRYVIDEDVTNQEFVVELDEYFDILELAIRTYIYNRDGYLEVYQR